MQDFKVASELVMRWIPVVDERGRTYLEAVWVSAGEPQHVPHAA